MSQFEYDFIKRLSQAAAEPRPEFTTLLQKQLVEREQALLNEIPYKEKERHVMRSKFVGLGIASMLVIAGIATVFMNGRNEDNGRQTTQTANQNTSIESSLSTEPADNVEDPLKSLSFTPLQPSILIADETPGAMTAGSSNGPVDTSDTLYMAFVRGAAVLYKITQTTKLGNYPEDAEPVIVTVKEQPVQAWYYQVSEEPDPSGRAPRTYLFMTVNGINLQISEFGAVTKEQLVKLANSLI